MLTLFLLYIVKMGLIAIDLMYYLLMWYMVFDCKYGYPEPQMVYDPPNKCFVCASDTT